MTRLHGVIFVCLAAALGTAMVSAGCSSSSSSASEAPDGASEASVTATPDGASTDGAPTTLTLQWGVVDVSGGGDGGPSEAGPVDAGPADAGPVDAGEVDAGSDGSVGDASVGDDASEAAAPTPGVDAATASDASDMDDGGMSLSNSPPLPGVTVCVYQNSAFPCVTTQADGTFTIPGLPVRSDIVLTLQKDGYNSYLLPIETASTDTDERSNPVVMAKPDPQPPAIGVPVDFTNKGVIEAFAVVISGANMNVFNATLGTSVSIDPMTANGPYYPGNDGFDLDASTFQGSSAVFYNVDPGMYTLTYANPSYDCEPISFPFGGFGWPVTTPPHSLKIVVVAGYVTGIVGTLCTPNPKIVAVDGG